MPKVHNNSICNQVQNQRTVSRDFGRAMFSREQGKKRSNKVKIHFTLNGQNRPSPGAILPADLTACEKTAHDPAFLPSPSALTGWFANATIPLHSLQLQKTAIRQIYRRNDFHIRCKFGCWRTKLYPQSTRSPLSVAYVEIGRPLGLPGLVAEWAQEMFRRP